MRKITIACMILTCGLIGLVSAGARISRWEEILWLVLLLTWQLSYLGRLP